MRPEQIDLDGLLKRLRLPTVRRVYPELAAQAEEEDMGHRDFLAVLIAEEVANRGQTRIRRTFASFGDVFGDTEVTPRNSGRVPLRTGGSRFASSGSRSKYI